MNLAVVLQNMLDFFLGWPLIGYVVGVSILCTVALGFVQLRYFFKAWKFTLLPERAAKDVQIKVDMTPFQAFVNALSTSLGNGSVAGMATAIYSGGPGAAFWLVVTGFITMSVRFAEVFLSAYVGEQMKTKAAIGGPMLYLKRVVGGKTLAYLYALFVFLFGLTGGNAIQTNSIGLSIVTTWSSISYMTVAIVVLLFMIYVLFGGAARIVKVSDRIVPIKVGVFFISATTVLIYHYQNIWPALKLIVSSAFTPQAMAGGVAGFAIQQAIRFGMMRAVFATESGLGTAAIIFGATGSKQPVRTGIMSMLVTFISTCVCFMISLCIVASGVWNSGLNSSALTIASYNTVFGQFGGWVVTFLSVSFGVGVLVTFAYVTREAWLYLSGGRFAWVYAFLYCAAAFVGALVKVEAVWDLSSIVMAGMLLINLFGIVYLLPLIRRELKAFSGR